MVSDGAGNYGVVKTSSFVGWLIRLGTFSRWNHAVISIGDGKIVEALTRGVVISPQDKYPIIAWNRHESLSDEKRAIIVARALSLVGEPYGFFDIALLALRILGLKIFAEKFLGKLARTRGYICSELVAECYAIPEMGEAYLVTPENLAERILYL